MRSPNMAFHKKTPHIRTPSVSSPPQDLLQEAPIGFHSAQELGLLTALYVSAPAVAHHPACEELVVS